MPSVANLVATGAALALATASLAQATINNMRGTIPGSLHQCQNTSFFFFDTNDSGSKTVLLVSPSDAQTLGSGIVNLDTVLSTVKPLQEIDDITAADATEFDFILKLAADTEFSTFGFLSDGQGKNLDLDRTVMTPLPDATSCLSGAQSTAVVSFPTTSSTSRFSTITRSSSSSSAKPTSTSTVTQTVTASTSITITQIPVATATGTASAAPAKPTEIVVFTDYLLTSFISVDSTATSDGTVSSYTINGGNVTGAINGTVAAFGSALFSLDNSTASLPSSSTANMTLLSATFSFTSSDKSETVFAIAQTPLSMQYSTDAVVITFQNAKGRTNAFGNATILGKSSFINSTMFRLDAYQVQE